MEFDEGEPTKRTQAIAGNVATNRCLTLNMGGQILVLWLCLSLRTANSGESLSFVWLALNRLNNCPKSNAVLEVK